MNRTGDAIFKETGYIPTSVNKIYRAEKTSNIRYWFYGILLFLVIFMFLPWTQNISASGTVTTLYQSQRPQQIKPNHLLVYYLPCHIQGLLSTIWLLFSLNLVY